MTTGYDCEDILNLCLMRPIFSPTDFIQVERIKQSIVLIRGQKVMLDRDLANLYGVETRVLNQAVRRNIKRFPEDFMFALTRDEIMRISQIVTSAKVSAFPVACRSGSENLAYTGLRR